MIQIALFDKDKLPNKSKIENHIQNLGYDFRIIGDYENLITEGNILECTINDYPVDIEMYTQKIQEVLNDVEFMKDDLLNEDTAFSFVWVADNFTGICIELISVALIDKCNALIASFDQDAYKKIELQHSRQELILSAEKKIKMLGKHFVSLKINFKSENHKTAKNKRSIWGFIKNMFK